MEADCDAGVVGDVKSVWSQWSMIFHRLRFTIGVHSMSWHSLITPSAAANPIYKPALLLCLRKTLLAVQLQHIHLRSSLSFIGSSTCFNVLGLSN